MSKRQLEEEAQTAVHGAEGVAASPTLAGKVVLVTGASSGIGRAIALACAEAGADVTVTYRTRQQGATALAGDRKSTRLNSSHGYISYAVFCLKKKTFRCTTDVSSDIILGFGWAG